MSWFASFFEKLSVAAVVGVFTALYRKLLPKRPDSQPSLVIANSADRKPTEPTPIQIAKAVEAVLPFDKERALENYKGLRVVWKVRFRSVNAFDETRMENGVRIEKPRWFFVCAFNEKGAWPIQVSFSLNTVPTQVAGKGQRHHDSRDSSAGRRLRRLFVGGRPGNRSDRA
jgi:hypothetical protein